MRKFRQTSILKKFDQQFRRLLKNGWSFAMKQHHSRAIKLLLIPSGLEVQTVSFGFHFSEDAFSNHFSKSFPNLFFQHLFSNTFLEIIFQTNFFFETN